MYCSFPSLWGSSLPLFEVCGLINFHGIKRNFYFLPTAFFTYIRSGWKWVLTPLTTCSIFYVLLTVHLGISLVNNQLDAQFFSVYVYFVALHVSSMYVGDRLICRYGWNSVPSIPAYHCMRENSLSLSHTHTHTHTHTQTRARTRARTHTYIYTGLGVLPGSTARGSREEK